MGYMLNKKQFGQSMAPRMMTNKPGTEEYYAEGPRSVSMEQVRTYGSDKNAHLSSLKKQNQSSVAKGKKPTPAYKRVKEAKELGPGY